MQNEKNITPETEPATTYTAEEAAKFIGVSRRTFDGYKLPASFEYREAKDGAKRRVSVFKESQLVPIKEQREKPIAKPGLEPLQTPVAEVAPVVALADLLAFAEKLTEGFKQESKKMLTGAIEMPEAKPKKVPALESWRFKLVLNFAQALALSGLPKDDLRVGLDTGKIKAKKRGNRWQIERESLEKFVSEYFD